MSEPRSVEPHPVYPGGPLCNPECPGPWSQYHDGYADGYEAAAQALNDSPEYDGTDAAHPAWWRGSDHAAQASAAPDAGVKSIASVGDCEWCGDALYLDDDSGSPFCSEGRAVNDHGVSPHKASAAPDEGLARVRKYVQSNLDVWTEDGTLTTLVTRDWLTKVLNVIDTGDPLRALAANSVNSETDHD